MIKNVFIIGFAILLIAGLVYQKTYLSKMETESKNTSGVSDSKVIVLQSTDFKNIFYNEDGTLKAVFKCRKLVYYSDASFEAEGDLFYQIYDPKTQKPTVTLQTDSGEGQLDAPSGHNLSLFSDGMQLKFLKFQENVIFDFNGNQGTAKNVFIDALKRTIVSDAPIQSTGPSGAISADGFFYDIDKKEFKLNSNVRGVFKPDTIKRNIRSTK